MPDRSPAAVPDVTALAQELRAEIEKAHNDTETPVCAEADLADWLLNHAEALLAELERLRQERDEAKEAQRDPA